MDLIQRLPKAALVTFVSVLLLGGSIGFVTASTTDPTVPETFQVAAPQVGDQWAYETLYDATEMSGGTEPESYEGTEFWSFTWDESTIVYNKDGQPRHVQPLIDLDYGGSYMVDHETKRIVAQSYFYSDEDTSYETYQPLPAAVSIMGYRPGISTEMQVNTTGSFVFYDDEPAPCGMHSDLQEGPVDLSGTVTILGDCRGFGEEQGETEFRAFETRTIAGIPTVGFIAKDDFGETRIWYNPDIPYPVAIEYTLDDFVMVLEFGGDEIQFRLDLDARAVLQHYVPGEGAWGQPSGELPEPLAGIGMHPPTTISVDDSGIDHPFKLSEAFDSAMADLTFDDLREFMVEHPDAIAVVAKHWMRAEPDHDVHLWSYTMWAPDNSRLHVDSERRIAHPGTPQAEIQAITGPEDSHDSGGGIAFNLDFTVVPEDAIPEQVVDLAEAYARFEGGTGLVPTSYGFDYTCQLLCFQNNPANLEVRHELDIRTDPDLVNDEPGRIESLKHRYVFGHEGTLIAEYRAERQGTQTTQPLLDGGPTSPPQEQATSEVPPGAAAIWSPPSAPAAAGAGALAVLVGVVYWLWPVIKGAGFLGLFSRLKDDQLLEHPVRSGIFQAVQSQPGIHYQGLIREVGKGRGVVEHHLRKLQQGGYVISQSNGGHTCFFPKGVADHRILAAVPVLKTDGAARVLRHIVSQPGTTITGVASALGIAKSTASHHVRRLREAGLLEVSGPLQSTPGARKALTLAA